MGRKRTRLQGAVQETDGGGGVNDQERKACGRLWNKTYDQAQWMLHNGLCSQDEYDAFVDAWDKARRERFAEYRRYAKACGL
jgi:hypothetical protein